LELHPAASSERVEAGASATFQELLVVLESHHQLVVEQVRVVLETFLELKGLGIDREVVAVH
jgi:hypothetical protein